MTAFPQGPVLRRLQIAAGIALGASLVLLMGLKPEIVGGALVVLVCLTALGALAVALLVEPPVPLGDQSLLVRQLGWLLRFVTAALLLGLSAATAVAAQADWDAAKPKGENAQVHALFNVIRTPMLVALAFGTALLAIRMAVDLWRVGTTERVAAIERLQDLTLGRTVPLVVTVLERTTRPLVALLSLLLAPLFVEVFVSSL